MLPGSYSAEVGNVVGLLNMALTCEVGAGLRRGRADLCSYILGQSMCNKWHLRISKWNQAVLTKVQRG